MLDADLADLYGVPTKALTAEEKGLAIAASSHLARLKYPPARPYAFTEHGALMLASVLNSSTAVAASIEVVRAFVRLREMVSAHRDLGRRLERSGSSCFLSRPNLVGGSVFAVLRRERGPRRGGFRIQSLLAPRVP